MNSFDNTKEKLAAASAQLKTKVELSTEQFKKKINDFTEELKAKSDIKAEDGVWTSFCKSVGSVWHINGKPVKQFVIFIVLLIVFSFFLNWYLFSTTAWFTNQPAIGDTSKPIRTKNETLGDALYFTMTTYSTIGYGDILPAVWQSRALVALEQIVIIYCMLTQL
jgi:hypothetical protein